MKKAAKKAAVQKTAVQKTAVAKATAKKGAAKRNKAAAYEPRVPVQKWRVKAITPLGEFFGHWSTDKSDSVNTINNATRLIAMVLGFATLQSEVIKNSVFILETTTEFV